MLFVNANLLDFKELGKSLNNLNHSNNLYHFYVLFILRFFFKGAILKIKMSLEKLCFLLFSNYCYL